MNKKLLTSIIVIAFILTGCGTPQTGNTYIAPQQISEPTIAEITPVFETQIERVNNCDGTNPTYNVSYKTIEAQKASFEVSVGAGGLVTGTPIPPVLEVQLEARITAALAKDYGLTTEKNHDLTLANVQGTFLEHTITWKVTRVKGLIEVIYGDGVAQVGFEKIANVELYNRTSQPLGCDGNGVSELPTSIDSSSTPVATLQTEPPPTKATNTEFLVLPQPPDYEWDVWSNASSVQVQGGCAHFWLDLTYKGGTRDYLEVCNDKQNIGNSSIWNDQIKDVEVTCNSGNAIIVTIWQDANFSGRQWQHSFCS